jgi:hypothetical protein
MSEQDRQSIGLTAKSQQLMEEIMAKGWFSEQQDVARLALACALRDGVMPGAATGVDTRWGSGLFDRTGELLQLIGAFYPDIAMPVRVAEFFVNEGLRSLHDRIVVKGEGPDVLFS